jgi:uncharacterized protein YuzE
VTGVQTCALPISEDINIDLDALGMVVGIELLDTSVSIPLDALRARYHIQASTLARLVASLQLVSNAAVTVSAATTEGPSVGYRAIGPRRVASL